MCASCVCPAVCGRYAALATEHTQVSGRYERAREELLTLRGGTDEELAQRQRDLTDAAHRAGRAEASAIARRGFARMGAHLSTLTEQFREYSACLTIQHIWQRKQRARAERERDAKQQ